METDERPLLSTVDTERAVAGSGRRRRVQVLARVGAAAGCAVAVLVGGWLLVRPVPVASVPARCAVQRLPVPDGQAPRSWVTGADPGGRYLIGRWYPTGAAPPLLVWHDGQVRSVAMPGIDPQLRDITSTGVAVGTSYVGPDGGQTAAWVYRHGTLRRLAGDDAEANAVNEHLTVAGSV